MMHAIKIEDLNIEKTKADEMVETFTEILLEVGFSSNRIENVSCRSRDGFSPFSHNKGGIQAYVYTMTSYLRGSGYDYGDGVISKWDEYQHESYERDHPKLWRFLNQFWDGKRKDSQLVQTTLEHYYNYIDGCSDYDTTQFGVRFMVKPDGTVDVDIFGSTMDAPYFRTSDYNDHINVEYKNKKQFTKEVMEFLQGDEVINLLSECY